MPEQLTAKELKFCTHFIQYGRIKDAAVYGGWSENTAKKHAHLILKRPLVQNFLRSKLTMLEKKFDITAEDVMEHLAHGLKVCIPTTSAAHQECNIAGGVACAQELNKMQGYYKQKENISVEVKDLQEVNEYVKQHEREY